MSRNLLILLGLVPLLAACLSPVEEMEREDVPTNSPLPGEVEYTGPTADLEPEVLEAVEAYPPPLSADISTESDPGGRRAEFPNTIIVYQREGKTPGSPAQWTIYHTGRVVAGDGNEWQVSQDEIKPLFELVEAEDFWLLSEVFGPSGECLDCLVQTLTVYSQGRTKEIVVTQADFDLPENLKLVLDQLVMIVTQE